MLCIYSVHALYNSSGSAVTAEVSGEHSGEYKLEPSGVYYIKVEKSSYTDVEATIRVAAGNNSFVASMATA